MFREKPIGKWVGPYVSREKDAKMVTLYTGDLLLGDSVDKFKPYLEIHTGIYDEVDVPNKISSFHQAPEALDYLVDDPI